MKMAICWMSFLLLPVLAGCAEPERRFRVSMVDADDYFALQSQAQDKVDELEAEGRTYWKIERDPWHFEVFVYRVESLDAVEDFKDYAELKRRIFQDRAQSLVADLEGEHGIVLPAPITVSDWRETDAFYEHFALHQISGGDFHLVQAHLIRFYRFPAAGVLSLEFVVRGLSDSSFDLTQIDSLLVPKVETLDLSAQR